MKNVIKIRAGLAICCFLLITAAGLSAQSDYKSVVVVLETPKQHIPDFTLIDRLNDVLAMYAGTTVILPGADDAVQAPNQRFDLSQLVNWGRESGARYILYIQIDDRKIITAKRWSIPLILSRYVVEGHLDGAYSLIDTQRGKLIDTWNLEAVLTGPQQWQVTADYPDDPDLHIPAPRKITFLQKLEDLAAAQIIRNIVPNLRGR